MEYVDWIREMLHFSSQYGIRSMVEVNKNNLFTTQHSDVDIGIALLEDGIYHYRTGHHRLGCARALGIKFIPCRLLFISKHAVDKIKRRVKYVEKPQNWRYILREYMENMIGIKSLIIPVPQQCRVKNKT